MNNILKISILFCVVLPLQVFSQQNTKVKEIEVSLPCKVIYTGVNGGSSHYNCTYKKNESEASVYSVTVKSLYSDMNGKSSSYLETYKESFLTGVIKDAVTYDLKYEIIYIDGVKAVKTIGDGNMAGLSVKICTIIFIYKKKSYAINHLSTEESYSQLFSQLKYKIKIK